MIISPYDALIVLLLGMVAAFAHKNWLYNRNPDSFTVSQGIVGVFWVHAVLVWFTGLAPWAGTVPTAQVPPVVAIFYTFSYLLLYRWGAELMFMFVGRNPSQGGILWLYQLTDRTEDFDASWRKPSESL